MTATFTYYIVKPEGRHRLGVWLTMFLYLSVIVSAAVYGFGYYRLPLAARAFHPLNRQLRPSGAIGIRLPFLGVVSFCGVYLYAIRKRWNWLGDVGKTRNWLVQVLIGSAAPLLIMLPGLRRAHGIVKGPSGGREDRRQRSGQRRQGQVTPRHQCHALSWGVEPAGTPAPKRPAQPPAGPVKGAGLEHWVAAW